MEAEGRGNLLLIKFQFLFVLHIQKIPFIIYSRRKNPIKRKEWFLSSHEKMKFFNGAELVLSGQYKSIERGTIRKDGKKYTFEN